MESKGLTWSLRRRGLLYLMATIACLGVFVVLLLFTLHKAGTAQADAPELTTLAAQASGPVWGTSIQGGGTFTYAVASDVSGLDPALMPWDVTMLVTTQIYETLVNHEPGGTRTEPGLAQSWSVSGDGLTWTFVLPAGATFHDGTALDAAAVVYNIERWWDPAHPHHDGDFQVFVWMFGGFRGDPACTIAAVSAVGTDQVQITRTMPDSSMASRLAMPFFAIASPAAIQAGTLATIPVGSGPFRFVEHVEGSHVRLAANASYWGEGPRLEGLVFQVISDEAARLAALQSNAVQGTGDFSPGYVAMATADANLQVLWKPAMNIGYVGINRSHAPLDNPLVRQAIAHAINKQAIIDEEYNAQAEVGQVAGQLLPPVLWGHDPDLQDYRYDPTQARSLLAQAGYSSGFTTTLWVMPVSRDYYPDPQKIGEAIQADLAAVDIYAAVVTENWGTYLQRIFDGEADLFMLGWMADYGHPWNFFVPILCDNFTAYGPWDATLCEALFAAAAEHDFETLVGIYQSLSRHLHDTLPLVPVAHVREAVIVRRNVYGSVPSAMFAASFKDVYFGMSIYLPVVIRDSGL